MMSRLSSVVKRHPPLCSASGAVAVPGRDTRRPIAEGAGDDDAEDRNRTGQEGT
jgi:hypothetical protein